MLSYRNDLKDFPSELIDRITGASLTEISNKSDCQVYKVKKPDKTVCYLKTKKIKLGYELVNEVMVYDWLYNKAKLPKVFYYDATLQTEYMLYSEIEGNVASSGNIIRSIIKNPNFFIKNIARALRNLHDININNCDIAQTLDIKLRKAKRRIEGDLVEEWNFETENKNKSPKQIYNELLQLRPEEDLVFTHGNFCLSNMIIGQDNSIGFVDMQRGGIADRYQDIALFIKDIKNKINENNDDYIKIFIDEYGIDNLNTDKVKYYILLNELF